MGKAVGDGSGNCVGDGKGSAEGADVGEKVEKETE
jgi:hypothetical protein